MSELTKEFLDKKFEHIDKRMDTLATKKAIEGLATSNSLEAAKEQIKAEAGSIRNKLNDLESTMNIKFDAIIELLDVRKDVDKLKEQVKEMREAMHLKA